MIIYKCTFPNGKVYIGQTSRSFKERQKEHKIDSYKKERMGYNRPFHKAVRKYGFDNLVWEIIDSATSLEELDSKEIYWIKYYKSYIHLKDSNGYNLTLGGSSNFGKRVTEESRKRISKAGMGMKNSNAKLTDDDIKNILKLIDSGWKQKDIAVKYGVKEPQISRIKNGTRWNSLTQKLNSNV